MAAPGRGKQTLVLTVSLLFFDYAPYVLHFDFRLYSVMTPFVFMF